MGRVANSQQQARTRARKRRIALDYDRAAREKRIEAAAAEAILALGAREDATGQVRAAEVLAGDALQRIIAEGVKAGGAARLCHLSVGEVHRFRRAAQEVQDCRGDADPTGQEPAGSPAAAARTLGDARTRRRGTDPAQRLAQQLVDLARPG
jgi:hypothetical protein